MAKPQNLINRKSVPPFRSRKTPVLEYLLNKVPVLQICNFFKK